MVRLIFAATWKPFWDNVVKLIDSVDCKVTEPLSLIVAMWDSEEMVIEGKEFKSYFRGMFRTFSFAFNEPDDAWLGIGLGFAEGLVGAPRTGVSLGINNF